MHTLADGFFERGIRLRMKKKEKRLGYLMLLPSLIVILLIQIYPFLDGVKMSFTNYNLQKPGKTKFIGLQNYIEILTKDKDFYSALLFSIIYAVSIVVFSYLLGMLIALLLNSKIRGRGVYRAIILMPWVIAPMVMAANWLWLLNDQFGWINHMLMELKLIEKPILFLTTRGMSRFTVIMIGIWKNLPFMTITLLAGMQGIPGDLYEAVKIDGGGFIKSFIYITLPSLRSVSKVSLTLLLIWAFNGFENIFLLTEGGPSGNTMVLPIYAYNTAFYRSKMGYASAQSVLMLICMVILSLMNQKINKSNE